MSMCALSEFFFFSFCVVQGFLDNGFWWVSLLDSVGGFEEELSMTDHGFGTCKVSQSTALLAKPEMNFAITLHGSTEEVL